MTTTVPSPAPAPKAYPGFAQALLVVLLFFLFANLAAIPALVLMILKLHRWVPWAMFLGQLGGTFLTLQVCRSLGGKSWSDYFPHRPVSAGVWPQTFAATAGLILVVNGVDGWVSHLLPPPAWLRHLFINMGWPSLVLGAPVTEEPLFRGLILGGFVHRYGARKAIVYSALLFGLVHLNPWQFPTGLMMGIFLGWLTLRTGSLWPAVFAHFLNNLAASLALAFHIPYLAETRIQPLWMWGLGILSCGLGLAGLLRMNREPGPLLLAGKDPA